MSWVLVAVLAAAPGGLELRGGSLEVNEGDVVQRLSLRGLTRDGWSCTPSLEGRSTVGPRVVHARACGVTETFTTVAAGLEHELVVATRPAGRGPLRVRLEVEGGWLGVEGGAQRFGGPGLEGWRYGAASLVRREGLVPLETRRVPGGLELLIPEAELARPDAFPLHIDPLVTRGPLLPLDVNSEVTPSEGDEFAPAVAFSLDGTAFLALWSDTRRSTNRFIAPEPDIYGALINPLDGGRLELVTNDPGIQDRAVVSAVDGGFVVAWEDEYLLNQVRVGFVSLAPDGGALVLTPVDSPMGSKPALSPVSAALGVVMAWVPTGMPQTVALRQVGGPVLPSVSMGFNVERVSVAVVGSDVWLAATDGVSQSKLFKNRMQISDQLSGDQIEVALDGTKVYVMVKNPTMGSPLAGVRIYDYDSTTGFNPTPLSLPGHVAMAWTTHMGSNVIGTVSPTLLTLRRGTATAGSQFMIPTTQELALAGSADALVAAYTTGPVGDRDLLWERVPSSNGTRSPPRPVAQTSASLRRNARVAFRGNRGLAVWLSNRDVRGCWLSRPPGNGEIALEPVFTIATGGSALGAVDLAFLNDDSAVVVWSALGNRGSQIQSVIVPPGAQAAMGGVFISATVPLVTALDVESTGPAVYVAWKEGTSILVRDALRTPPNLLFPAVGPSATFDFSCSPLSGRCVGVVEDGTMVRTATFPPAAKGPSWTGAGPVAASMDNDQALVAFRNGMNLEVVNVSAPTIALDRFPLNTLEVRSLVLAGAPLVLAGVDHTRTPPTVRLGVVGEGSFTLAIDGGWNPDVALSLGGQGMVVVTQDDLPAASTLVSAQRFQVLPSDAGRDAGTADAGLEGDAGLDAGTLDAGFIEADAGFIDAGVGVVDAGVADGGTAEPFLASGCTCDALSGAWATWLVLAWVVRRRR